MSEKVLLPQSIQNMAEKITFVSFDVIQFHDNEMRSHWYRYEDIDLYYFQNLAGDISKIHISVFGEVIEWNPLDGLRSGLLIEAEGDAGITEVIQYDARPSSKCLEQAVEILRAARNIELHQREQLICCLINGRVNLPKTFWQRVLSLFK